jgi:hypothetical protein
MTPKICSYRVDFTQAEDSIKREKLYTAMHEKAGEVNNDRN